MHSEDAIYIAGHTGLVGSALYRNLRAVGYQNLIARRRSELDLCNPEDVDQFFSEQRPKYVFLAAARVGGIAANSEYPYDFLLDNLKIQNHVIDAARRFGCQKLTFLGSSCIYPKFSQQPIHESSLLCGPLEPTNESYAIAKIAGIKLCQAARKQHGFDAISVMPTNLYGPNDNFNLQTSHVLPALIVKAHQAKMNGETTLAIWGSGQPRREFMHADDLADACIFLMKHYSDGAIINVGSGEECTIAALAEMIKATVGADCELEFDTSQPDGTPRKLMDSSNLHQLGWQPRVSLADGLRDTYQWYLEHNAE